jgi:hypothetical protein
MIHRWWTSRPCPIQIELSFVVQSKKWGTMWVPLELDRKCHHNPSRKWKIEHTQICLGLWI